MADCILLLYDITNRKSFDECKFYYNNCIKERCKKNIRVLLVGNKADLEGNKVVNPEEGACLALENDYIFIESSCLKNRNVSDAFEALIEITNIEVKKQWNIL